MMDYDISPEPRTRIVRKEVDIKVIYSLSLSLECKFIDIFDNLPQKV